MTVDGIRTFIQGVDPGAKHYWAVLDGDNYTVWSETERIGLEDECICGEPGWRFEIVRYTRDEYDDMPGRIEEALKDRKIAYSYTVEARPEAGYILHSFVCMD